MKRNARKRTFVSVRPAKIQISLRIRTVWSESSLGAFWVDKDIKFNDADDEDSDETARMRRMIWVFLCAQNRRYVFSSCGLIFVTKHIRHINIVK